MVVKAVNKVVQCIADSTIWTVGAEFIISDNNDVLLKQSKIIFAPGCGGFVDIRILKNGGMIIPDPANAYSDAFVGDDILIPVYVSILCKKGDSLRIEYRNTDKNSIHSVEIIYEFQNISQIRRNTLITDGRAIPLNVPKNVNVKTRDGEGVMTTIQSNAQTVEKKVSGYEHENSYMTGGQKDYSGDWQEDLPGFLQTEKTSNGGRDPRIKKRGRGGS